jgi:hypothetical protein
VREFIQDNKFAPEMLKKKDERSSGSKKGQNIKTKKDMP